MTTTNKQKHKTLRDLSIGRKDIYMLDPSTIKIEPGFNIRNEGPELDAHIRELADSIKEIGVQEPITVFIKDDAPFLSDGHCRLRAVLLAISEGAEIKAIPAMSEDRYSNDADRVLSLIVRNAGKPLTPIETAGVIKRLIAFGWDKAKISAKTGLQRGVIDNHLILCTAPAAVEQMIVEGKVSATTAIKQLRDNPEQATSILEGAVATANTQGKKKATPKHLPTSEPKKKKKSSKDDSQLSLPVFKESTIDDITLFIDICKCGVGEVQEIPLRHFLESKSWICDECGSALTFQERILVSGGAK